MSDPMAVLETSDTEELEDQDVLDALGADDDGFEPELLERFGLPFVPQLSLEPRSYQREALQRWLANSGRGVVVLPTGAGKTVVAYMAMVQVPVRTLVIVPTIDLLRQWQHGLSATAGVPADSVGVVGGGQRVTRDVTVMTYDSASMPRRRLADFGLLIVDEVHHLPAPTYRAIVGKSKAPWRLGLSATPERADGAHLDLAELIGPEVYRRLPAELASQGHIASYDERRIFVDLTAVERYRYDALMAEYRWYLATRRGELMRGGFFEALIKRSSFDPGARRALQAQHQARMIALNAESKLEQVEALLSRHRDEQVLIFSEYTAMVQTISQRLGLPAITYRTDAAERRAILERFRSGRFSKLVSGRVLNEGVDVPDANVAIVVSGSAASREYIQRLGRVLRPKPRRAVLYEIISRRTTEGRAARARRPSAA
jgi:superfamily II DNA or RNA helicase